MCAFFCCPLLLLCMFVLHSYFQYPQSENEICGTATEMQLNWNWSQKPPANKCLKAIVSQNVSYLFIIWSLASHHTQALLYTIYNIYIHECWNIAVRKMRKSIKRITTLTRSKNQFHHFNFLSIF